MKFMTNSIRQIGGLRIALLLAVAGLYANSAYAQFVPGPYYYPDAGVMGSVTSAYQSAAQERAYNQNRQLQTQSSMARSYAWQNINQSMQNEAASRTTAPETGQEARQWIYQNTQRTASRSSRPTTLPESSVSSSTAVVEPSRKSVPREIMLWPTVLKGDEFDQGRADVEAPFRRAYASGSPLTAGDYRAVIRSVEKMKAILKEMSSQMIETEYAAVNKFLDDLIVDANKRIESRKALGEAS